MSRSEAATDQSRDDPLTLWSSVRATALDAVALHPLSDEEAAPKVAWRTTGQPVVLDHFTHAVWEQLDGTASVADLATELTESGFPGDFEPMAVVATAVAALVEAGLASTRPDQPPPLGTTHRRTLPGAAIGGLRWIHHDPGTGSRKTTMHEPSRDPGAPLPPHLDAADISPPDPPRQVRVWFERTAIDVHATDPEIHVWLDDLVQHPPTDDATLTGHRVGVVPTDPPGFQITVDGRPTDWADSRDVIPRLAVAVVRASGALPPDAVVDLGPGWVATEAVAGVTDPSAQQLHQWRPDRFLTSSGELLVPTAGAHRRWVEDGETTARDWHVEPVTALSLTRVATDPAEILADLAAASRATDRRLALQVLSQLIDRVDAGPPPPVDEHAATSVRQLRASHSWTDHVLALGDLDWVSRSVKIRTGALVTDRPLAWLTPHPDLRPDRVRSALQAVGLPPEHAEVVTEAIAAGRPLAIGPDGSGPRAARKLYIQDPAPEWWATVRDRLPGCPVADPPLADGSVQTADDPPVFVAWKWGPEAPRVAAYWSAPHHDLVDVMGGHLDWTSAVEAFPLSPVPGPRLLLVESTGRRSLDIALAEPTWGAKLEPLLRRVAAVARLDDHHRDLLIEAVGTGQVARVIGGLDAQGRPLVTLYMLDEPSGSSPTR